jgi:hypothetical protein
VSGLSELQPAAAAVKNLSMLRSQLCLLAAGCCSLQVLFDPTIGHRHIAAILLTAQHHRASAIAASILSTHSTVKRKREENGKQRRAPAGTHFTTVIRLGGRLAEAKEQGPRHRFHLEVWNTWIPPSGSLEHMHLLLPTFRGRLVQAASSLVSRSSDFRTPSSSEIL